VASQFWATLYLWNSCDGNGNENGEVALMRKLSVVGGHSSTCPLCGWSSGAGRGQLRPRWRPRRAVGLQALVKYQLNRARNADVARDHDVAFIHKGQLIRRAHYLEHRRQPSCEPNWHKCSSCSNTPKRLFEMPANHNIIVFIKILFIKPPLATANGLVHRCCPSVRLCVC